MMDSGLMTGLAVVSYDHIDRQRRAKRWQSKLRAYEQRAFLLVCTRKHSL